MKKVAGLVCVLCVAVILSVPAVAADYVGKSVPSKETIRKGLEPGPNCRNVKVLGKRQVETDSYQVVYSAKCTRPKQNKESEEIFSAQMIKLDTDIWLVRSGRERLRILQK